LTELEGERVEADDGYREVSPRYVKCPASIGSRKEMETAAAFARRRHETINQRFKQWGVLKQVPEVMSPNMAHPSESVPSLHTWQFKWRKIISS
jgi:hypothetical protein